MAGRCVSSRVVAVSLTAWMSLQDHATVVQQAEAADLGQPAAGKQYRSQATSPVSPSRLAGSSPLNETASEPGGL